MYKNYNVMQPENASVVKRSEVVTSVYNVYKNDELFCTNLW